MHKEISKLNNMKEKAKLINEPKIWTNLSSKKICEWQMSIGKDASHYLLLWKLYILYSTTWATAFSKNLYPGSHLNSYLFLVTWSIIANKKPRWGIYVLQNPDNLIRHCTSFLLVGFSKDSHLSCAVCGMSLGSLTQVVSKNLTD